MVRTYLTGVVAISLSCIFAPQAQGTVIPFDLSGKAGPGLIAGNENHTIFGTPGSGGEAGSGILFDNVANSLAIQIAWGSGNGFTNLTGATTGGHIHGPTASGAPGSFTQDASILIGLDTLAGWNGSATNGSFNNSLTLTPTQATQLLAGQLYINVHTSTNSGGEIRGYLVPAPEPGSAMLIAGAVGAFAMSRRRV
jgi:hypothetical protein